MARGASIGDKSAAVADDASADIKPAAGKEWIVTAIGWSGAGTDTPAVNIDRVDATSGVQMFDSKSAPQVNFNKSFVALPPGFQITNTDWLNVENVSGAAIDIWWTGVLVVDG